MENCDGCKCLYYRYGSDSGWWCSKGKGREICKHDVDTDSPASSREVPKPDWCPLEKEVQEC